MIVFVFLCAVTQHTKELPEVFPVFLAVLVCFVIVFVLLLLLFFHLFVSGRFLTLNPVSLLCPAVIDKYIEKEPGLPACSTPGARLPSVPD